jgi:hypothetical protein
VRALFILEIDWAPKGKLINYPKRKKKKEGEASAKREFPSSVREISSLYEKSGSGTRRVLLMGTSPTDLSVCPIYDIDTACEAMGLVLPAGLMAASTALTHVARDMGGRFVYRLMQCPISDLSLLPHRRF